MYFTDSGSGSFHCSHQVAGSQTIFGGSVMSLLLLPPTSTGIASFHLLLKTCHKTPPNFIRSMILPLIFPLTSMEANGSMLHFGPGRFHQLDRKSDVSRFTFMAVSGSLSIHFHLYFHLLPPNPIYFHIYSTDSH